MEGNQLAIVSLESGVDLAHLNVPELGSAVHGAGGNEESVGVEGDGDNFSLVPVVGGDEFASHAVPDLGSLVEGAGADSVAVGYVEGHAVYGIFVPLEGVDEVAGVGVPQLAGAVVAASDELVPVLVEAAVGEGQHVALQLLHQHKLLLPLLLYLPDQLFFKTSLLLIMAFICGLFDSVIRGSSAMISVMSSSMLVYPDKFSRSMHLDSIYPLLRTYSRVIPGG